MDEAIAEYQKAVAINPDYSLAHNNLAAILLQRGNLDEAFQHFREAVRIDPMNAEAQDNLGRIYRAKGQASEAIAHFREAVQVRPNWPIAVGDLAWTLATAREDTLRDAGQAVRYAEHAADLTERREPDMLDILAAAYAAAGDFDRAVATADSALRLGPPPIGAAAIRARQELYKQRKPYRRP
jgi:tetratricopeptide (TPR) repeat protein